MPKKSNKKRDDGRIAVQVYLGIVDGKRKYKTVYGQTQKEANEKAQEIKARLGKGLTFNNGDTFAKWADYWLLLKETEVSKNQYNTILSRVSYWKENLGSAEIIKLRPIDLQPIVNELAKCNPRTSNPTAKKTLSSYVQILTAIFDYCIDNRVIDFNPASRLKIPNSAPKEERRGLTSEERQRIVEFEHRGKPAMMLLLFSGLRRGEATALLWSDIDFKKHTISVTRSYDFKQRTFKTPKNGKSRTVSVPSVLIDYLKTLPKKSTFVLTNKHGEMMTESSWKRLLESYLCDMNLQYGKFAKTVKKFSPEKIPFVIEPFTLHCLRHTFCTMMYEAGVDILVAQKQMGHSDVKTTLAIYTHLEQEHKQNNISKLDEYISNF